MEIGTVVRLDATTGAGQLVVEGLGVVVVELTMSVLVEMKVGLVKDGEGCSPVYTMGGVVVSAGLAVAAWLAVVDWVAGAVRVA